MRIELNLPDWVNERHVRIFAGGELAAEKHAGETQFRIKDVRCNLCGRCCMNRQDGKPGWEVDNNGTCEHLRQVAGGHECAIYINAPFGCHLDPLQELRTGECCITYR